MGNTLVALGKNRAPFQINVLVTSLTFLCSYFIIPRLGYMGVVYIAFAGSIFAFILNYVYLCNAGIRSGVGLHYFVIFACFTGLLVAVQTSRDILFVISVSVLFLSYAHLLVSFLRCVKHRLGGGLMEWRRNGRLPSALT
jgi:peptidoglycan biosynthesis protein MviN/MurJ (putative lipid II flippase)